MTRPVDLNNPEPGFYLVKLVKDGPFMPCAIWRGCPIEMEFEYWNYLDRWPRLEAMRAGAPVPVEWIWPGCARFPMPGKTMAERAREYEYRMAVKAWADEHDPTAPEANPRQAIDHMKTKVMFT